MKKEIIHEIESELKVTQESIMKAYPSIYCKEDVLRMLDGFTKNIILWVTELKEQGPVMSIEGIRDLSEQLMSAVTRKVDRLEAEEVVDFSSASMSISYNNQIEIDSMDFNSEVVNEAVELAVDEVLHDYFLTEAPEEIETPYATEQ
jgi:uncharacterized protein (DUF2164 family)